MGFKVLGKLKIFLKMIRVEHTVFALPFAYVGALLAHRAPPGWVQLVWLTLAMVGARTAAMSLNRLIDRHIDAQNPRTSMRALPRGLLSVAEVWVYTVLAFVLLGVSAYHLSRLAFELFPVAVAVLWFYSYVKRFTWLSHLVLGAADGLAPLGAWVAIADGFAWAAWLLFGGVMFWVAGFDVIYAVDDYHFDRQKRLHSIPVRFGIPRALVIARWLHVLAVACFLAAGFILHLGVFYWAGALGAAVILVHEHLLVTPEDMSRAGVAFFNLNGILSVLMLVFTVLDVLVPVRLF
ncbi:MAG: putative 4-hydroxybenzoate polyprenyltransferase [Peptococcaceae bacterium]|jgi:4-hydroxybenzoate polyprenyltransferase|nr:putative 4-hydroxybenzoate polyprenyltransferase [Peptococcaceae bacterium]